MNACERCGVEARPSELRMSLVNLVREDREDGRPHTGPDYDHQIRCKDKEACRERARRRREPA